MMTQRDVATVVHVHLRALQITDPYNEDYYYHNFQLKGVCVRGGVHVCVLCVKALLLPCPGVLTVLYLHRQEQYKFQVLRRSGEV